MNALVDKLTAIRARWAKLPPGPWRIKRDKTAEEYFGKAALLVCGPVRRDREICMFLQYASDDPVRENAPVFRALLTEDIPWLLNRVEELKAGNAGLRRALEPFARLAREFDDGSPTGETWPYDGVRAVTYGDLRHAHAALEVPQ